MFVEYRRVCPTPGYTTGFIDVNTQSIRPRRGCDEIDIEEDVASTVSSCWAKLYVGVLT